MARIAGTKRTQIGKRRSGIRSVVKMTEIDYEQFRDIVCRTCWKREDVGCQQTEQEIRGCWNNTFEVGK